MGVKEKASGHRRQHGKRQKWEMEQRAFQQMYLRFGGIKWGGKGPLSGQELGYRRALGVKATELRFILKWKMENMIG